MSQPSQPDNQPTQPFDSFLLLTICLTIFAIAPLFYPGYFQTHTGYIPLWSIDTLKENLVDWGWLPALITFNPWRSDGLLPYYLAALLPVPSLTGFKIVAIAGLLAGSSGLYLWLKSWLGSHGACLAAIVYTYAPFTIATLYVRGAWGETFFWGMLPWALLAATFLVAKPQLPIIIIAALFWTALGLSQLGLTVWAFILMAAMLFFFHRPQVGPPLLAAGLGLLLAIGMTLPRILNQVEPAAVNEHLVYPSQLLSPFWGFGTSQPGFDDGLSLSLGLAAVGLAILTISIWRGGPDPRPWFFIAIALAATFLALPISGWLWRIPGLAHLVSFPWQLLGFATLGLSVLAGIAFWLDERLKQMPIFPALLLVAILPMYPNLAPQYITTAIPDDPQAIYGANSLVLLSHQFLMENPAEEDEELAPDELYLPWPKDEPPGRGDLFLLQVRWQAIKPLPKSYKIFAHVVDEQGQLITQVDVLPQNGERPTDTWQPGEQIEDIYRIQMPRRPGIPDAAQVWLGFYDEETLERVPALGDDEGRAFLDVD